jgi:exosortase A-associated hydrolase 2
LTIVEEAFHLPVAGGQCFAVYRAPPTDALGAMLHLPAFGDEMNKSRAMTARAARAFVHAGIAVLQVDWQGCGDSTGEHRDATLSRWVADAQAALAWLLARNPGTSSPWLWALRAGALLVDPLIGDRSDVPLLLWQPVVSGKHYLNQLLRLKAAGAWANAGGSSSSTQMLRARLAAGEVLEIGGYEISPTLADELEKTAFDVPPRHAAPVVWLEVTRGSLSAAAASAARRENVSAKAIAGPGFWQSVEIERCDELIAQSSSLLAKHLDAVPRARAVF